MVVDKYAAALKKTQEANAAAVAKSTGSCTGDKVSPMNPLSEDMSKIPCGDPGAQTTR